MGKIVYEFGTFEKHVLEARWSAITDYLQIYLDGEERSHMSFSFILPRSLKFLVNDGNEKRDVELKINPDLMHVQRFVLLVDGNEQSPKS